MFELLGIVFIVVFVLRLLADTADKKPGLLYLLAIPLAILTLPFKLASDMEHGRGAWRRRGGRRRRR